MSGRVVCCPPPAGLYWFVAVQPPFSDRAQAGRLLADKLAGLADRPDLTVLALPRGGVPVAAEVAWKLHAPLDVFVVRKLGVPGQEELAMGAIASGGVRVIHPEVVGSLGIPPEMVEKVAREELRELERRERAYRREVPAPGLQGKNVVVVDDGLATGSTMLAAVAALRQKNTASIVVAAPVMSPEAFREAGKAADGVVALLVPGQFSSVGQWYGDFRQTTDGEVRRILARADVRFREGRL